MNVYIFTERMGDFTVRVGESSTVASNPSCASYVGPVAEGATVTIPCETQGRYVGILRNGDARFEKSKLDLCEVVVMGYQPIGTYCL